MTIDQLIGAVIGFIAGAFACWLVVGRQLARPPEPLPRRLSEAARILNQLTTELEQKRLAKVDRDAEGRVRRVHWAGEGGVWITGEGSQLSQSSSREPDADQGPRF